MGGYFVIFWKNVKKFEEIRKGKLEKTGEIFSKPSVNFREVLEKFWGNIDKILKKFQENDFGKFLITS